MKKMKAIGIALLISAGITQTSLAAIELGGMSSVRIQKISSEVNEAGELGERSYMRKQGLYPDVHAENELGGVTAPKQVRITVRGVVRDDAGTVAGANIVEKGTTNGTGADMKGEFSLNVASNATIVVSYIGYVMQEIAVNGRTSIEIRLTEDYQLLDEVIVVGYCAQKKINLTGSVATVSAEQITNRATPNLSASLSGLAPGVRVTQGRGTPGDESVSIRIRGLGSINSSSPMILVDGVVADMTVINPEDVESINFLKDAASAAIYGLRAANGVVLVTTKKGRQEKPRVTVSSLIAREQVGFINNSFKGFYAYR